MKTRKRIVDNLPIQNFPVAGVGASAGGLDAIKKLLNTLPENTGLAFVIIQHLAPNQESMLPEILSRHTSMPVSKVENGMPIEPNSVYVIPSGKTMTIEDGALKLQPKEISTKPIDAVTFDSEKGKGAKFILSFPV